MGLTDTESAKVLRRFDEARRERRAWKIGGATALLVLVWLGWSAAKFLRHGRARARGEDALEQSALRPISRPSRPSSTRQSS